jgi:hypothetical protein
MCLFCPRARANQSGYVYVLRSPVMPDVVKIGFTQRKPQLRADELSDATGVPVPFEVAFSLFTANCRELERAVHKRLKGKRVNTRREFFAVSVSEAREAIVNLAPEGGRTAGASALWLLRLSLGLSPALLPFVTDLPVLPCLGASVFTLGWAFRHRA